MSNIICIQCKKSFKPTRKYLKTCKPCTNENKLIQEMNENGSYLKFRNSLDKMVFKKVEKDKI